MKPNKMAFFGRETELNKLTKLVESDTVDYYESALFYPNLSLEDKVRIYSVFGGIPYYNRLVDDRASVKENVIELMASPGARLENEVSMYLSAELAKITNANEVFAALAAGFTRYSDILSQSHVSSGPTLVDVLDKLIHMEMVQKYAPINVADNKKRSGYTISDNISRFYYRYIFRYLSQRSIMDTDVFYAKYIEKDFEASYVPHLFEDICKQYLIRQNRLGRMKPIFEKIGKYYYDNPTAHRNGEFDVVTEDEFGYVFYEAKFRQKPMTEAELDAEMEQVRSTGLECYRYGFISRGGFSVSPKENQSFLTLEDLYA